MEIKKSSFHPISSLEKKSNYKPYYRIERDGTILERIMLDIPDVSIREHLVCLHFMQNFVKVFFKEFIGINILSRDDPWDFKIELSTGDIFNIEITSIAEDAELFEKLKREERFALKSIEEEIPFHELEKLNRLFPSTEIEDLIREQNKKGISKKDMVANPYKGHNPNIFLSSRSYEKDPLDHLIKKAIESKEKKNHIEKGKTVLIIDNRTLTYEYSDLHSASDSLQKFYKASPFREIWFYTGYCSDLDGNNAEYSMAPLKITEIQWDILEKTKEENPPDNNGLIYL